MQSASKSFEIHTGDFCFWQCDLIYIWLGPFEVKEAYWENKIDAVQSKANFLGWIHSVTLHLMA